MTDKSDAMCQGVREGRIAYKAFMRTKPTPEQELKWLKKMVEIIDAQLDDDDITKP
jgi:hypothetical protein